MRKPGARIIPVVLVLLLVGCDPSVRSKDTIHLPKGDADYGKNVFMAMGCISCHTVLGADLPESESAGPVRVVLGSSTSRALTYGQIVTSIVNPSHRLSARYPKNAVSVDGVSRMTVYNEVMTIAQLSDLAAFLAKHYEKAELPGYRYPVYTYGADEKN